MERFNQTDGLSKASNGNGPVPAARMNQQDPISSGLLISVIKTLTSTLSDDQRQLERSRLEKGYQDSGLVIDRLLNEHQSDVSDCMNSFRTVSNGITNCRERIHNVKNALHTCKSLLQCRRDDLKKLWMESAEQRYMNSILQQIHEMKHMDQTIEQFLRDAQYREAVDALKRADILLNGPLSQIDGLNQLRTNVTETCQTLFEKIVQDLLHSVVVVPFDIQNLELMKSIGDTAVNESVVCVTIISRYSPSGNKNEPSSTLPSHLLSIIASHQHRSDLAGAYSSNYGATGKSNAIINSEETPVLLAKINESLEALKVFDLIHSAMESILSKSTTICIRSINDSIALLRLLMKDGVAADSSHLAQLIQVVIYQMRGAASRFTLLIKELERIRPGTGEAESLELLARFWETMQTVFETLLSDHLHVCRSSKITSTKNNFLEGGSSVGREGDGESGQEAGHQKTLFSFENTSFSSTSNSFLLKKKQLNLLCTSTPYNITAIFHLLNRFCVEIETRLQEANGKYNKDKEQPCRLNTFLHSFMDNFVERIRKDMEKKTEIALMTGDGASGSGNPADVWSSLSSIPSHNVKVLTSCLCIFELCEQINQFIHNMAFYTQRFASLWLLIIADYTKSATDMYSQIIRTRSHQGENLVEYPKISAAWAVDEDISRLLKSLPNWTVISQWSPMNQDTTPLAAGVAVLNESEQDVRQRTQRESEILIGNLGTQKQIQRVELITDMEHVKSLVCMHESLQWFASNMRMMIANLPSRAKEIIKCRIQIRTQLGPGGSEKLVEQLLSEALEERLLDLESMSETCLLMLHLEIRVHCFYHLLPLVRSRNSLVQDEQDREVVEFGRDITQFHQTLSMYMVPNKLKYLFDGLGHLCASIFIHSSQYMNKLLENDRKRVCRNIYSVQKFLSALSNRPETEMSRAQTFFKLVNIENFDQIFALVKESGEHYTHLEFTYLLALAVRSHPVLSSQPGALESMLGQLRENLSR